MSPVPTITEFAVIACLFLIFIAVYDARNALVKLVEICLLYTSPSPRDRTRSRMPSSA